MSQSYDVIELVSKFHVVMKYSFLFPLVQKLWKLIKKCKTYSRKATGLFFSRTRCIILCFVCSCNILFDNRAIFRQGRWPGRHASHQQTASHQTVSIFTRTWLRYVRVFAVATPSEFSSYHLNLCIPYSMWFPVAVRDASLLYLLYLLTLQTLNAG